MAVAEYPTFAARLRMLIPTTPCERRSSRAAARILSVRFCRCRSLRSEDFIAPPVNTVKLYNAVNDTFQEIHRFLSELRRKCVSLGLRRLKSLSVVGEEQRVVGPRSGNAKGSVPAFSRATWAGRAMETTSAQQRGLRTRTDAGGHHVSRGAVPDRVRVTRLHSRGLRRTRPIALPGPRATPRGHPQRPRTRRAILPPRLRLREGGPG